MTKDGAVNAGQFLRQSPLQALVPAVSGKIELVYEGEQQGPDAVARHIIGQAVKTVFHKHFPKTTREPRRKRGESAKETDAAPSSVYDRITHWFSGGNRIEISDAMPEAQYAAELRRVSGLEEVARRRLAVERPQRFARHHLPELGPQRGRAAAVEVRLHALFPRLFRPSPL